MFSKPDYKNDSRFYLDKREIANQLCLRKIKQMIFVELIKITIGMINVTEMIIFKSKS